jgi:hypothetical protein
MLKLLTTFILTIVLFILTPPAYSSVSRTMAFQLSVTIPEHVFLNNNLGNTALSTNAYQLAQTQTVIRNTKTIRLTSIVVP